MPNLLTRAVAAVRGNPALAVAVGGVGLAAAVSVGRRRGDEAPPTTSAVDTSALPPIGGYGAGLTQPLPGVGVQYSDENARGFASVTEAIANQSRQITEAIARQDARGVVLPVAPVKEKPASLPADLGTIVIGLRNRYPKHYQEWLKYAGAGGVQPAGESRAQRESRLRRELAFYTAKISGK